MSIDLPSWMTSLGTPRPKRLRLPEAPGAPAELKAWHALLDERAAEEALRAVRLYREFPLQAAEVLTKRSWLVAKLTGTFPMGDTPGGHGESAALLAPSSDGNAAVFEWADEDDAEITRSAGSIQLWLYDTLAANEHDATRVEGAPRPRETKTKVPSHWDPPDLLKRSRWLLVALDQDPWNDRELKDLLKKAPPVKQYASEAKWMEECPHLAAYWVWALFLLDDRELLEAVLPRFKKHPDPFVHECAEAFEAILAGRELPRPMGPHDAQSLTELRHTVTSEAPRSTLSLAAKERLKAGTSPKAAVQTPLEQAQRWMKKQYGDLDVTFFWEAVETDSPEMREFVVQALEVCHHPDPVDSLTFAALKYGLTETIPSLRRIISNRIGFPESYKYGYYLRMGGVRAVRALVILEGPSSAAFLREELKRPTPPELRDSDRQNQRAALVAGLLCLEPTDQDAIAAAREVLEGEASAIRDGVVQRFFYGAHVAAILWAVEKAKIRELAPALRPFAAFTVAPDLAGRSDATFWSTIQKGARSVVAELAP